MAARMAQEGDGVRILIVDDDPLMTDMLPRRIRAGLRAEVVTASTPEEGLAVAERVHPEVVRILFSGHARHEIGPRLDEADLHGFLEKPMRLDEMIAPLASIIQGAL